MSRFVIYVSLPKYLSEWLTCHLGNPVVFPPSSPQNAVIRTFIKNKKLPEGIAPDCGSDGETAIAIPYSVAKPPETYNYMSPAGKAAVAEACMDLFLRALWADLSPLQEAPVGLNSLIRAWCESNGIDIERVEAVRQKFYRIRKEYAKSGIILKSNTRKK